MFEEILSMDFSPLIEATTSGMSFLQMMAPPEDISENGHLITYTFNYITIMIAFFFLLVCVGLFGFSYFYSKRKHPKPVYTHGDSKLNVLVTIGLGLAVFISIDMAITGMANNDFTKVFMKFPKEDEDVVRIEVMAQQWMWNIRYAGKDGIFNSQDDIVTTNDLRVPKDKKVVIHMTSKDVIHSLYLPNIKRKVDAMPGRISRMWFKALKAGEFELACAEMCGTHHYLMKAKFIVHTQNDFDQWLEEGHKLALNTNDLENIDSFWGWKWAN